MQSIQYNQKEFDNFGNVVREVVDATKSTFHKVNDATKDALAEAGDLPWLVGMSKAISATNALVKSMSEISEEMDNINRSNAHKFSELNGGE